MMNHINAKIGLAYLEGRLDTAQQAQIQKHLVDCPICQAHLLEHQTTHDLLQAAAQDFAPKPTLIPNWADVKPKQEKRPLIKTLFQYGNQLAMVGAAVILLLLFIWQLQPQEPLLEVAPSVTVTSRPISGPTPLATALPSPAVIIIPSLDPTRTLLEPTAEPTLDISALETPTITGNNISAISLSSQGQAAFIADGVLYIETTPQSAAFAVIAEQVSTRLPAWSADGKELLFFSESNMNERPIITHWTADTGKLTTLNELVDRPLPDVSFQNAHWATDSREILLPGFGKLTPDSEWDSSVWLVDLDTGNLILIVEAIALKDTSWLTTDEFIMTLDCGRDCTIMMAYNKDKTLLWKAYAERPEREAASDLFVIQQNEQRILHLNTFNNPQTVDVQNTTTGAISTILTLTEGLQFSTQPPQLAENGRILIFQLTSETNQPIIIALNLDDLTTRTIPLQHETFTFGGGAWDTAGNYFIYNVMDSTIGAAYVYRWQPGNNTTELIQASAGDDRFQNFTWTADGRYVYYNLDNRGLWQYDVVTEELRPIAGQ